MLKFLQRKPKPRVRSQHPRTPSNSIETQEKLPELTYDLLTWLDEMFPPRHKAAGEDLEEYMKEAGARELIELLIEQMNEELKTPEEQEADAKEGRTVDPRVVTPQRIVSPTDLR